MRGGQLRQLDPRSRLLLVGGTALVLVTALVSLLLVPELKRLVQARDTLSLLQASPPDSRQLVVQNNQLRDQVVQLQKALHGDMAHLPGNQLQTHIVESLQQISWQHQMQLSSMTPREGQVVDEFKELVFELELQGSYQGFADWLTSLQQRLGFVVISRFNIRPVNATMPEQLRISLTMIAYRSAA